MTNPNAANSSGRSSILATPDARSSTLHSVSQNASAPHVAKQNYAYQSTTCNARLVVSTTALEQPSVALDRGHPISSRHHAPQPASAKGTVLWSTEIDAILKADGRENTKAEDQLLTDALLGKLCSGMPARFLSIPEWTLLYSTEEHGFSLSTMYANCKEHVGPTILAVRDSQGALFGVFATETWKPHFGHYGTGECFLWKAFEEHDRDQSADALSEALTAVDLSSNPDLTVSGDCIKTSQLAGQLLNTIVKYGATGRNNQFMISEKDFVACGCSDGRFGLWLDEAMTFGQSHPTSTFDNDILASESKFTILNVELWGAELDPVDL